MIKCNIEDILISTRITKKSDTIKRFNNIKIYSISLLSILDDKLNIYLILISIINIYN